MAETQLSFVAFVDAYREKLHCGDKISNLCRNEEIGRLEMEGIVRELDSDSGGNMGHSS